jgi:hypothetical protein
MRSSLLMDTVPVTLDASFAPSSSRLSESSEIANVERSAYVPVYEILRTLKLMLALGFIIYVKIFNGVVAQDGVHQIVEYHLG